MSRVVVSGEEEEEILRGGKKSDSLTRAGAKCIGRFITLFRCSAWNSFLQRMHRVALSRSRRPALAALPFSFASNALATRRDLSFYIKEFLISSRHADSLWFMVK